LTHLMSSDPNTVASLLARMQKVGLVERKPHERDGRAHRINLQAIARRKYEAARALAISLQTELLSVLPEDKREEFLEHLALIADACRDAAQHSPKNVR